MKKTAVITGGTGAIGSMTAYLAVQKGYKVVLAFRQNEAAARQLLEDLAALGGEVQAVRGDLTQEADRQALAEKAGPADLLVNNFGVPRYREFTQETPESITQVLNENLLAHMALTRLFLPGMLRKKQGAVINISSIWGQTGGSCEVAYSAAKAGLIGFTKALAKELAPSGVTVNCVAPGCVESRMLEGLDREALKAQIPTGRLCSGLDVARCILFLAEQEQVTGQVLAPNGGQYI